MIEFINFRQLLNPNQGDSWKLFLKIGLSCILIGYVIFILKELIVGFISLIFFVILDILVKWVCVSLTLTNPL